MEQGKKISEEQQARVFNYWSYIYSFIFYQPALTYIYASEEEVKTGEQVHRYACKKVLSVSQKTPMIYSLLFLIISQCRASIITCSCYLLITYFDQ